MSYIKTDGVKMSRNLLMMTISSLLTASSFNTLAAVEQSSEEEIEQIQITGSRILRTDLESAKPVTVITKADIQATGLNDIASVLSQSIFNSAGSTVAHANNSSGNFSASNLRGLGSNRTLTLVNGRRVAGSSSSYGNSVNVNLIPLEVVERIDILRDGASSIYGSDAMGGVINIITKKDYEGIQVSVNASKATQGGADQTGGSLTYGTSNDKSSILVVLEHQKNGSLLGGDRPHLDAEHNPKRWSNSYSPWGTYYINGDYYGDDTSSPLCPEENVTQTSYGEGCGYDVMDGKFYLPEIDKTSAFISFNYDISDDLEFYNTILYTRDETFTSSTPMWAEGTMSADNINNPTRTTSDPQSIHFMHYMEGSVPREFSFDTSLFDVNTGINWMSDEGTLSINLSHSKDSFVQESNYYYFTDKFQTAVDEGLYNPLAPAGGEMATEAVLDSFRHTQHRIGSSISKGINIDWAGIAPFELTGGEIGYAIGGEYRKLTLSDQQDAMSNSGSVKGAYGGDTVGERNYKAAYVELELPFTETLTISAATRYDQYSLPDQGQLSSSLSARYEATEDLILRASYSEGFRVADINEAVGEESVGFQHFVDPKYCNPVPVEERADSPFCRDVNEAVRTFSNPNLKPELSEQISAGLALNITDDISLTLDYWAMEITNQITSIGAKTILDEEYLGNLGNYDGLYVNRDLNEQDWRQEIQEIGSTTTNYLGLETSGIDLSVTTKFDLDNLGSFKIGLEGSYILEYKFQETSVDPVYDYVGYYNRPEFRASLNTNYYYDNFQAFANFRHVDSFMGETPEDEVEGTQWLDFPSMTTLNVGVGYTFEDLGQIQLISSNVLDKMPPVNTDLRHGYSYQIHSIMGRTVQLIYSQNF
ncbi:TonB-dependent receptor [Pseudoalteromonas sp. C2R02]|uniref:TonB-dependent receptor plug domain-containing protein n=1 Tax=Pseudoalteromonas sp. C2R02 TaxID=2841565 RepID=UPI001C08BD81|nr:TonB-dependent receptor [Pseudoalteromonas sp. C2R02]MBU2970433.1 TonB-dependent receptor [Pseudoalteromonas sp. C2R02]